MEVEIKAAITKIANDIKSENLTSDQPLSQAVLNLANALAVLKNIERIDDEERA